MTDEVPKKGSVDDLLADVEAYIDDWFQAKLPFTLGRLPGNNGAPGNEYRGHPSPFRA
jgi:hypothetical protein